MPEAVRCFHLLVKHQGSRRPASWRDPQGDEIKKRSPVRLLQLSSAATARCNAARSPTSAVMQLGRNYSELDCHANRPAVHRA